MHSDETVKQDDIGHAAAIAARVEQFVREQISPYESDPRCVGHGPAESLVEELRAKARAAGVMTPHILADGSHLTQRETAMVLKKTGLSILGPVACNTGAPDEGNMYLIGKVGTPQQRQHFLLPVVSGHARSAFLMTEPAADGGAGSDPSMLQTTATLAGDHWVINGRKAFITGFHGAKVGIVMARTGRSEKMAATMFLVDLPNPAIRLERVLDTIDSSMPGGPSVLMIDGLRVSAEQVLGKVDQGLSYAQVRLNPARLSHCMRWHGVAPTPVQKPGPQINMGGSTDKAATRAATMGFPFMPGFPPHYELYKEALPRLKALGLRS